MNVPMTLPHDSGRPSIIRGAKLLDANRWRGENADLLIIGDSIAAVAPRVEAPESALAIDGTGLLIHPGFVNGHTHGHNALAKGTGDRWTLELLLAAGPWITGQRSAEDRYLSAALNAAEMALKGCTAAYDLFLELPEPTVEGILEAIRAYQDVGIRVTIAPMLSDISLYDAIPGLFDALPSALQRAVGDHRPPRWQDSFRVMEALAKTSHFDSEQVHIAIAPTIPMHCSDEFLQACRKLADDTGLGIQSHVAESKVQLIGAEKRYHSSIVAHLNSLGLIRRNFTVAHGVWLSDEDMETLAAAGASVSVNPGSNMRLGNGLPDVRRMLKHGVNVAVGTDGSASSDNQNMYEATRLTSYVSRVNGPDPSDWLTSQEAFYGATCGGSRALGFENHLGRLSSGAKADLVFLDLKSINWLPMNDPLNQLAYVEDGLSVRHVMVGGRFIVKDRRLLTIDLQALAARVSAAQARLVSHTRDARDLYNQLEPFVASFCPALASTPHPVHRYCHPE
jgi:5-methylthioadenosine/S-adenosylhomocysteine deaminase